MPPSPPAHSARVNVIGNSGSGKSTFARQLAAQLGHPYVELDALFWLPNWQQSSDEVFFAKVETALAGDAWVLDGNYTRTVPIKWRRVQTVIWLDYPLPLVAWRSIRRAISRAATKQELWPDTGNHETFQKSFLSKDSIVLYSISHYHRTKRRYETIFANPNHPSIEFLRLRSPVQSNSYIQSLAAATVPIKARHCTCTQRTPALDASRATQATLESIEKGGQPPSLDG